MATAHKSDSTFSQEIRRGARTINPYGNNRAEWWLNVNYAEVIDMRDAVNSKPNMARASN
ncbi:hypothetical protein AB4876_03350 [Zhongshania guokunii]|uniref:Uncharacterized protein n=1 Tax=Zhongshania guokunii TaxID=641783 RepID=A0ABV3U2P3_9GAMM